MINKITDYISKELGRDPGICILTYPYSFAWQQIEPEELSILWAELDPTQDVFAYVHIPFCSRECHFCGFHKLIAQPYPKIQSYLESLHIEVDMATPLLQKKRTLALTIGGGTPSLLKTPDLANLLSALTEKLNLSSDSEVTVEVYPDKSATKEKFAAMIESGANRVSLGFQSLSDEMKRNCNRHDTVENNVETYRAARDAGFKEISVDLLCGLPRQTMEIWKDSVQRTIALAPDQVCYYPISVRHPGIPFYENIKQTLPAFETLKKMYFWAQETLISAGYQQVTRHNFKKPHHLGLYEYHQSMGTPCLGLGANSISFLPGYIYKNVKELESYTHSVRMGKLPVDTGFDLVKHHEDANSFVIKRLTYLRVDKKEFKLRFEKDFDAVYPEQIEALTSAGLAVNDSESFRLTDTGTYYTALAKRCFFSGKMHHLQTERLGHLPSPSRECMMV